MIQTLNGIEYPDAKEKILSRLSTPDQLGIVIDKQVHYGKNSELWVKQRQKDQERLDAWNAEQSQAERQ